MQKKVSIKDIARTLGVSTALVSYVLNNKEKEARVGKEMAQKIRQTAIEMNYQPNQIARSLKSGKTNTIGVIVADISNPFFANIARIIEDEAKKDNYTVIFGSSDENPEKLRNLIDVLLNRQVDGLIIVPTVRSEDQIRNLHRQAAPFVLIDRYFPEIESNYIVTNNYQASYDAVSHLISSGYKRICMVAYKDGPINIHERERGYLEALKDHHLSDAGCFLKEANHANVKQDVERIIQEALKVDKVDSIFFATNTLATNGLKCVNTFDLKVPSDLGIVTFDEGEAFDFFYSPLTFVKQPGQQIGKLAVEALLAIMNHPERSQMHQVCVNSELVIRNSSVRVG